VNIGKGMKRINRKFFVAIFVIRVLAGGMFILHGSKPLSGSKPVEFKLIHAAAVLSDTNGFISRGNKEQPVESPDSRSIVADQIGSGQTNMADTTLMMIHADRITVKGKIELTGSENDLLEIIKLGEHSVQAVNVSISLPRNLFTLLVDSISFDHALGKLNLSGVKMLPHYSKEEFHKHVDYETDRIEADIKSIVVTGFQADKAINERMVVISRVEIREGVIDVYRDRRPPFDEQQRPDLPAGIIRSAPFGLHAGTINLSGIDILYSEFPEDPVSPDFAESTGVIPFTGLSATISNISNISDSLERDSIMQIKARAVIFDKAVLTAEFCYNLKDPGGGYSAAGELNELPFPAINQALYPLAGVKAAEGVHKSSVFSFSGNDVETEGELFMEWSDLSIELTPDEGGIIRNITATLGEILYHSSNPDSDDDFPSGKIEFERDVSRFVFHYWWNSYLSGIKNSVLRDFVPL
jgi:hypothetical protein